MKSNLPEVGDWTPYFASNGAFSGQTYSVQQGKYIKIGDWVFVSFRLEMTAKGTIGGNLLAVAGLPFPVDASFIGGGLSVGYAENFLAQVTHIGGYPAGSVIYITNQMSANIPYGNSDPGYLLNNSMLYASTFYKV